ncbi:MAG TPA: glycoside hydrolase, partial [Mycobacterium sp.]|nr:glycoside hydrolase [Mycobacterium sp.]
MIGRLRTAIVSVLVVVLTFGAGQVIAKVIDPRMTADETQRLREAAAREAGRGFLSSYVGADGRVVRRDEGGDVVSEGQAYG